MPTSPGRWLQLLLIAAVLGPLPAASQVPAEAPEAGHEARLEALDAFSAGFQLELDRRFKEALSAYETALDEDPGDPFLMTRIARCYLEIGNHRLAGHHSLRAIQRDSTLAEALWIRGISLAHAGAMEEALPWLRKAALANPDEESYASALVQVLGALGRIEEAAQEIERMVGGAAESARWLFRFGHLLLRQGRREAALGMFERVVEKDPQNARAWETIGDIRWEEWQRDEAADAYLHALEIGPDNGRLARNLLPMLVELERWDDARNVVSILNGAPLSRSEATEKLAGWLIGRGETETALAVVDVGLEADPESEALLRLRMRILTTVGSHEEVLEASRRMQEVVPDDVEALRMEAAALADGRSWDEALRVLDRALTVDPDDVTSYMIRGEILATRQEWARSEEAYREVIARDSSNVRARFRVGVALERMGRIEDALDEFRRLVELEPDYDTALNYMGYMCIEKGIHIEEAMGWVRRAIEQRPDFPPYLDSLGWGYFRLDRPQEALTWLRKAVDKGGRDPEILLHLAEALQKAGLVDEAAIWAKKVLDENPDHVQAQRILRSLEAGETP